MGANVDDLKLVAEEQARAAVEHDLLTALNVALDLLEHCSPWDGQGKHRTIDENNLVYIRTVIAQIAEKYTVHPLD